jgi:hypothetical protein
MHENMAKEKLTCIRRILFAKNFTSEYPSVNFYHLRGLRKPLSLTSLRIPPAVLPIKLNLQFEVCF